MHTPWITRLTLGVVSALLATAAIASDFPNHPVHLVVPFPPGGASDLMGRILGQKMSLLWNEAIIIDNKPGAAGSLGTGYAARQPADGYTYLMGNQGPSIVNPLLSNVPYNMEKDFIPVSLIATGPAVLVVNKNSPYKTLNDLINAARAKPGSLNFGSGGTGTLAQLGGEMLNDSAHIKMQHVPYKGGIAAVNDVVAGHIDLILADMQAAVQLINGGDLRALAITSAKRSDLLPNVPTFAESGLADMVALNSWSIYLPAGVPAPIVAQYHDAINRVMQDPDLVKLYNQLGVDAVHTTTAQLAAFTATEGAKYRKIIKDKHIHIE
jgi:tripartite-type tricarboxylate transporter receptor subunit TctC